MLNILESLDLSKNPSNEQIYNLFKTSSQSINKKIRSKIQSFNSPFELIEYYSKTNIKDVMNLFDSLEKSLNNICDYGNITNYFSSNLDQYMSYLSKIILITFLISKFQLKITDVLTYTKINLLKMNLENQVEINSKKLINIYINNLIKNVKNKRYSRRSTKDGSNNQTPKGFTPKNNTIKNNTSIFVDSFKTAKFNELENIHESQLSLNNNSVKNDYIPKESQLTLSGIIFTPSKKCSKSEKQNNNFRVDKKISKNNNIDKTKNTNMVIYLLETINSMYKRCLINADEKVKLKTLIISKSIEIEKLYIKFHDKKKNVFMKELKKLLDKL